MPPFELLQAHGPEPIPKPLASGPELWLILRSETPP